MKKIATGIFIICTAIVLFAFAFTLYGQLALDYSLENLKQALETSETGTPSDIASRVHRTSLEAMTLDEMLKEKPNFETVVLLEHASRAMRDAIEESGYARAGVYLVEVLRDKSSQRNTFFQIADSIYRSLQSFIKAIQDFWAYLVKRFQPLASKVSFLEGAGVLLLGEAERMENNWKLEEAARLYQEFLDRYPGRPERGFVTIYLAHVLIKMRHFEQAETLLKGMKKEFSGTREEALAINFLNRITTIRRHETEIPELEKWVQSQPERIFKEEGGLRLALSYLATYQLDRALTTLEKLSEAPEESMREKALFYRGWILTWKGDLEQGKEILKLLEKVVDLDPEIAFATEVKLAAVSRKSEDYEEALDRYEELSRNSVKSAWKSLSELEQSEIYLFGLGDAEAARQNLERIDQILTRETSVNLENARLRIAEAIQRGRRDEGFGALAQGRVEIAYNTFTEYLEKFPRDGSAHSALATIYLLRGDLKQAQERAEKGYGLEQDEYTAAVLGYVYEKLGRLEDSGRYYLISTQFKESYLTAQFNLAWIYLMTGRYKEADDKLAVLGQLKPEPPKMTRAKILNNRGVALWLLDLKKEATSHFEQALKIVPDLLEAQKNLVLEAGERPLPAASEASI